MKRFKRTSLLFLAVLLILTNLFNYGVIIANANNEVVNSAYEKLYGSIALYVGSTQALVENTAVPVDTTVSSTKPIISNNRTLVPVRFVSEKLGAYVAWNSSTQTVSMKFNKTQISLRINDMQISVNNTKVTLDVAPIILNGRTYVPLRAISEAFGNHVFYYKRLIVISDTPIFNINNDTMVINEICNWFKQGKFPNYIKKELSLQEIAENEQSVVTVIGYDKNGQALIQGSGFAVAPGLFATCLHVLQECESYKIVDSSGNEYTAEGAVAYAEGLDLALLKSHQATDIPMLSIGGLANITKGDSIITISSPKGLTNSISQGIISNVHSRDGVSIVQFTAPIAPGSSGGALFNMYGEVIGVISFGYENSELNFAIPSQYLEYWLTSYQGKNLNDIALVTLPEVKEDDDGNNDVPPNTKQLTSTYETMLDFEPIDIAFNPTKPLIYAADKGNKLLYEINYETNKISKMPLSYMPEALTFANGQLYVALAHQPHSHTWWQEDQTGTVLIINPNTFTVADSLSVSIDPFDIAVDKQGYIYVSSGSGQWTNIHSYSPTTKSLISKANVYQKSNIEVNQVENKLYVTRIETSQREMGYYSLLNGQILQYQKYNNQGNVSITSKLVTGPDGAFVFNSWGVIFDSSLSYVGKLSFTFVDMAFNAYNNDIYTIAYSDIIYVYDYPSFEQKHILKVNRDAKRLFIKQDHLLTLELKNNRYYFSVYNLNLNS
ncbi:trypsin-like peptidase domain-containing protein [Clostridium sp. 'deep sea']|uniref:stalk domain-containing protein n=1 Tax=Clostridium sp. 'deep sea' TaxID=2779445 RepID=UPI0018966314|nr:stalk domain-containing protein [Clostridium sp. 'deep sea']QOR36843.1 trypsin-like peptidase domain-containing protein [Clostridium sp. 'deep sea']